MIFAIFMISMVVAFGMDVRVKSAGMILTRGQADALYMIMIVSLIGMVVTLGGFFA